MVLKRNQKTLTLGQNFIVHLARGDMLVDTGILVVDLIFIHYTYLIALVTS